ncbi:hypothetical protein BFS35_010750 [Macrococcoides goetzii]|uniref:Uncharacterized protein n=1 Tax=Macrococcoides goetzii TaxID=1891097 RepID=A0A395G7G2_9STAP|nr:oligosaccharide flippase family protein [Macrococcus goetzii]RAI79925.1 hypothetical protein BFS35_010750 [Macrococcus goetzii]
MNRFIYLIYVISSSLFGFLLLPILNNYLSGYEIGMYALLNSLFQLCIIIPNYSVNSTIIRFYSKYKNNEQNFKNRMDILLKRLLMFSILAIILVVSFYNLINPTFSMLDTACLVIVFITFLLYKNVLSYFQAGNFQKEFILFSFGELIFRFTFTIILLILFENHLVPFWAMSISSLLIYLLAYRDLKNNKFNSGNLKISEYELSKYFRPLIFSSIFMWILSSSDQYMLDLFLGKEATGKYLKGYTIPFQIIIIFTTAYMMYFEPVINSFKNNGNSISIRKEKNRAYLLLLMYGTFILIFGCLFSEEIYKLLYGENEYGEYVFYLLISLGALFWSLYKVSNALILIENYSSLSCILLMITAIINVVINIILIPKMGIYGAALSTTISYLTLFLLSLIANEYIKKKRG